jgi:voltage-gated potassium channel
MSRMTAPEISDALARLGLFRRADHEQLGLATALGAWAPVPAGRVLLRAGDARSSFVVVLDGEVTTAVAGEPPRRRGPGSWFGEMAMLARCPEPVTVTAATDGSVLTYDLASFTRMLDGVPCVAVHLLRDSSTRLQQEYTASRRRRRQLAEAEHVLGANPRGRPG